MQKICDALESELQVKEHSVSLIGGTQVISGMEQERRSWGPRNRHIDPAVRQIVYKLSVNEGCEPRNMFNPEDAVFHEMFGVGKILHANGSGVNRKLQIDFRRE